MKFEYGDIPADLVDTAEEWRTNMVEAAAEASEELMDKYLEEGDLSKKISLRVSYNISSEIQPMFVVLHLKTKVFNVCWMLSFNSCHHQQKLKQLKVS